MVYERKKTDRTDEIKLISSYGGFMCGCVAQSSSAPCGCHASTTVDAHAQTAATLSTNCN